MCRAIPAGIAVAAKERPREMWVALLRVALLMVLSSAVLLSGCGQRAADISGVWQGTFASNDGQTKGTFRATLRQQGQKVDGSIETSAYWLPKARIDGSINGRIVRWGVVRESLTVLTFEGQFDGDEANGRYGMGSATEGRWSAQRLPR